MRLLIANQADQLLWGVDQQAFSQRILWFADDNDLVVLPVQPDRAFLRYVTSMTGADPDNMTFHVPPQGRFGGKVVDPRCLLDREFIGGLSESIRKSGEVHDIFPLWPTPSVARLAAELDLLDSLRGAGFYAQGGGELCNSKAHFRAMAAGAGVPITPGAVCNDIHETETEICRLIENTGAVMIKQVHNIGGIGNQLVVSDYQLAVDHAGAKYIHYLEPNPGAIRTYLDERWNWASNGGRYPVIVEEFHPGAESVYAEFLAGAEGVGHTSCGSMGYRQRTLVRESIPLRNTPEDVRIQLITLGRTLASSYQAIGYRGYLSADALVDSAGNLVFTEMNARVTGSLHLYDAIGKRLVDINRQPERIVTQYLSPKSWPALDLDRFLSLATELGCRYDHVKRCGVVVPMPLLPHVAGGFYFCIVSASEEDEQRCMIELEGRLGR